MSRFDTDGGQQPTPLLSPAFLGLVDHAFFRCPFASMEGLVTAASSDAPGAGVSEADINGFLDLMAKDHTHKNAAADLKKGKSTTGWIPLAHWQMDLIFVVELAGWLKYLQEEKGAVVVSGAAAEDNDEVGKTPEASDDESGSDSEPK